MCRQSQWTGCYSRIYTLGTSITRRAGKPHLHPPHPEDLQIAEQVIKDENLDQSEDESLIKTDEIVLSGAPVTQPASGKQEDIFEDIIIDFPIYLAPLEMKKPLSSNQEIPPCLSLCLRQT